MNEEKLIEKVREAYSPGRDCELEADLAHQRELVRVLAREVLYTATYHTLWDTTDRILTWAEAQVKKEGA